MLPRRIKSLLGDPQLPEVRCEHCGLPTLGRELSTDGWRHLRNCPYVAGLDCMPAGLPRSTDDNDVTSAQDERLAACDAHRTWVIVAGWSSHLANQLAQNLLALIAPPCKDENVLRRVCFVFESLVQRAVRRAPLHNYAFKILFDVITESREGDEYKQDMAMFTNLMRWDTMDPDVWVKHIEVMRTILCYAVRIYQSLASDKTPEVFFTKSQMELMAKLLEEVSAEFDEEEEDLAAEAGFSHLLTKACLDFVVALADQELKGDPCEENVMISALAVMGLGSGSRWQTAQEYAPQYAAVTNVLCLLVVEQAARETHDEAATALVANDGDVRTVRREASVGLPARVRDKARRFMMPMAPPGAPLTPMGWIHAMEKTRKAMEADSTALRPEASLEALTSRKRPLDVFSLSPSPAESGNPQSKRRLLSRDWGQDTPSRGSTDTTANEEEASPIVTSNAAEPLHKPPSFKTTEVHEDISIPAEGNVRATRARAKVSTSTTLPPKKLNAKERRRLRRLALRSDNDSLDA